MSLQSIIRQKKYIGKNINIKELEDTMNGRVYQYNAAARSLSKYGWYTRSANHMPSGSGGMNTCCVEAWTLDESGNPKRIFTNLKPHRAKQAIKSYNDYLNGKIPCFVWENYITNGYSTRRGLYANYEKNEERIRSISRSHADMLGNERNSTTDHNIRVKMRNN